MIEHGWGGGGGCRDSHSYVFNHQIFQPIFQTRDRTNLSAKQASKLCFLPDPKGVFEHPHPRMRACSLMLLSLGDV